MRKTVIARFTTLLPFVIYVPDKQLSTIGMSLNNGEYEVVLWPPAQAVVPLPAIESDPNIDLGRIPQAALS
jgi:hypothetical protein